jgi:hypothetical protein
VRLVWCGLSGHELIKNGDPSWRSAHPTLILIFNGVWSGTAGLSTDERRQFTFRPKGVTLTGWFTCLQA